MDAEYNPWGSVWIWLAALLACADPFSAIAATFNQLDDFQGGTTLAWGGNKFGAVTLVPSGGPNGVNDAFLQTSVTGFHLGTKNTDQWAGNFLEAGIEAIEMDLNHLNPGEDRLTMRILLFGPGGTFASRSLTTHVPTNSWRHYVFGLTTNDLVRIAEGPGELNDTLTGVTTLLLRHDRATPTPPGTHPPHITATLGIDNIHAVSRQPVITDLSVQGNLATLDLTRLVKGTSFRIEKADHFGADEWSTVSQFEAGSETTNTAVTLDSGTGYLRTTAP